ncbi:MAG: TIGR02679 family protein [Nitriliruptoraceae bacterium]
MAGLVTSPAGGAALPPRLGGDELAGLWERCWRAMARAGPNDWASVTLRVPLDLDGDDTRRAISGILGRPIRPGTAATTVRLGELDELLRRADRAWDLRAVVEHRYGPLPDRAGDAQERASAIAAARGDARSLAPDEPWVETWLADLDRGMLTRLHTRGELDLLSTAARVLAELPADGIPLPALASHVTGDTKALGPTTLAGLVLRGIARRLGEPVPRSTAERRALWEASGVVPDDLASQVLVLNLAPTGSALAGWLREATAAGLPFRVTLQQLARQRLVHGGVGPVFVCENPAVLRAAAEQLGAGSAPLVCTEGRPSMACLRLLDGLVAAGGDVRYHGDFDWPGLRIGASLLAATGGRPWRFGAADYHDAVERGGRHTRLVGSAAESPWDPELARAMTDAGRVVYEEDVLDPLLEDLGRSAG